MLKTTDRSVTSSAVKDNARTFICVFALAAIGITLDSPVGTTTAIVYAFCFAAAITLGAAVLNRRDRS